MQNQENPNNQNKAVQISRKTLIIFGVIVVLIIVGCAVTFGLALKKISQNQVTTTTNKLPAAEPNVIVGAAKEGSVKDKLAEMQKQVDENSIGVEMNIEMSLENGDSEGNAMIGNPETNTKSFVVFIVLDDTQEEVYRSGLIPPNSYIDKVKLTKSLDKGTYPATAYYEVYNTEGEITGVTGVNMTIHVLN